MHTIKLSAQLENCIFIETNIKLPFPPFPGLRVEMDTTIFGDAIIDKVIYNIPKNEFECPCTIFGTGFIHYEERGWIESK